MIRIQVFFLFLSMQAFAQSKIIGKVFYQNSGWKPVEGVLINANGSNGDYSKTNGDYLLKFPNLQLGYTVQLSIGKDNIAIDGKGKEVELVNEKELEYVSLPENPQKAPIKIIVCPKGARDMAARRYYGIIKNNVEVKLSEKRREVIALREQLGKTNDLVIEKEKRLLAYKRINDSMKIYVEAFKIASINRDGAKKRVKNYLNALDAGVSVSEARKELNTKKAYNEALKSVSSIKSSIEEIQINAKNHELQLKYDEAFGQYDTITKILKSNIFNPLFLFKNYSSIAILAQEVNRYEKAIKNYKLALNIIDGNAKYDLKKSVLLYQLGLSYAQIKQRDLSEKAFTKSLKICESLSLSNINNAKLFAKNCSAIGTLYISQKKYVEAYNLFNKSIDALMPLFEKHSFLIGEDISFALNKKAFIYQTAKLFKRAEEAFNLSVSISNTLNNKYKNSFLVSQFESYLGLGQFYFAIEKYEESKEVLTKGVFIGERLSIKNPERYNLQYAELLNLLTVIAVMLDSEDNSNRELVKISSMKVVQFIEELITVYNIQNTRLEEIKNMNSVIKFYYSENTLPEKINVSNSFIALLLLKKERQLIEQDIKLLKEPKEKLNKRQLILKKTLLVYNKYTTNINVLNQLRLCYASIAILAIEAKEYDLAMSSAKKVNELDKSGDSFGFMNLVLVNAYILQNKLDKGWNIYKKYKNEPFPGSSSTYKTHFLADIIDLEKKGVHHKEFAKIKSFLR